MKRKKNRTTKIVLLVLALFLITFTAICIWLFYLYQTIPDTLITCVFGICGTECGILGWIRTSKTKYIDTNKLDISDLEDVR